jgi:hypothetical protein
MNCTLRISTNRLPSAFKIVALIHILYFYTNFTCFNTFYEVYCEGMRCRSNVQYKFFFCMALKINISENGLV